MNTSLLISMVSRGVILPLLSLRQQLSRFIDNSHTTLSTILQTQFLKLLLTKLIHSQKRNICGDGLCVRRHYELPLSPLPTPRPGSAADPGAPHRGRSRGSAVRCATKPRSPVNSAVPSVGLRPRAVGAPYWEGARNEPHGGVPHPPPPAAPYLPAAPPCRPA